ncbi:MAG TPA: SWIM zinc finger family protein [Methyloceanibacter sp.]|nr:SWIM zinc finger family protein [Methyloceanibacter sp.]
MSYYEWRPYVPVADRRRKAEKKLAKLKMKGQTIDPVRIEGRTIAKSFWGRSWCTNLERYSDFASRLPRGRTYVRNGSVLDLQIAKGQVRAQVSGSKLYSVKITMAPVTGARWKAICRDCAGCIDSLVELLQGRVSKGVMDRVCREGDGLFPAPREIRMSCSCPDWADMCKHVAAVLYGVGARLDHSPALLFKLRGVDADELLARAGEDSPLPRSAPAATKVLDEGDVAALFGLEMDAEQTWDNPTSAKHQRPKTSKRPNGPTGRKAATSKERIGPRTTRRVTTPSPTRALKRQASRTGSGRSRT